MSDLISRKALMEDIRNTITESSDTLDWINLINKQPTAYDVSKVVEQLEHDAQMLYSINAFEPVKAWRNDLLISVVKGGLEE